MKKLNLIFVLFVTMYCFSQNKQLLYNFTSIPQSLMTNPGSDVKYKWYFGIPLLSGVSLNVGSTGFSAYDLFADNGVDFNAKLRHVLNSTTRNDRLALNEQIELISGGFRVGTDENKGYVSFGMYQELDGMIYMPKDIAILAIDGNKDYLGKSFNLGDLNMKAEMLNVFHFGYHKNSTKNFIFGVRGKIYSSIFNATSTKNSGEIVTTLPSDGGVYKQVISSDLQLNTSGFSQNNEGGVMKDVTKKALLGGNLGLGIDLGITYYPKENIQFTASLVDVGFIRHTKETQIFIYKGYNNYLGVIPKFNEENEASNAYKEFKDAIPLETLYSKYITWRPVKLYSSLQYSFEEERPEDCDCLGFDAQKVYKNAVGAQLFVMSTPRTPLIALTGYYNRKIFNGLQIKTTYTIDSYSYKNIGLGLSSHFGPVNLYVLADNLLEYKDVSKAKSLSFQFGLNVIFK